LFHNFYGLSSVAQRSE